MFERTCDWVVRAFRFEAANTIVITAVEKEIDRICKQLTTEELLAAKIMIKQITFGTRIISVDGHSWYREVFCSQPNCNFSIKASGLTAKALTHECSVMWDDLL